MEIENFRCTLPLNANDEEMFPLGFVVNYNTRKQIEFENFGNQPPSPLVLILTDTGILTTFFAINRQTNQSICYESKALQFKNYQIKVTDTAVKFNTGSMQPSASMFGLNSNAAAQLPKTSQSTLNFNTAPINQTPALKPQHQMPSMLPNQAQQQQQPAFKMNIPPPNAAPQQQQQKPLPQFQPQPIAQQQIVQCFSAFLSGFADASLLACWLASWPSYLLACFLVA